MRFVDIDHLDLPAGWEDTAKKITEDLRAAIDHGDTVSRDSAMARAGRAWSQLRIPLQALSFDKCWYCETKIDRADANVDHYRPKGSVIERDDHPGYWWLVLSWRNFRLSCQFCNQRRRDVVNDTAGGKRDHFPIVREEDRALSPDDNISAELCILLDPTEVEDLRLLTFGSDGVPGLLADDETQAEVDREKVRRSIELYHLNHRGIVDQRKLLFRDLQRRFDNAVQLFSDRSGDVGSEKARREVLAELKRAVSERAELSASARAYLRTRRSDGQIAEVLVARLLET